MITIMSEKTLTKQITMNIQKFQKADSKKLRKRQFREEHFR